MERTSEQTPEIATPAESTTDTLIVEDGNHSHGNLENNGGIPVEINQDGIAKVLIPAENVSHTTNTAEDLIRRERIGFALKVVSICTFAYLGVLARVFLSELNRYLPFFTTLGSGFFLPNIVGSFAMGVLTKSQNQFRHKAALYAGLSTGFCGCCTTFATWQAKVAYTYLHNGADAATAHLLLTFCTSFCAFEFGTHIVSMCHTGKKTVKDWRSRRSSVSKVSRASFGGLEPNYFANLMSRKRSIFERKRKRSGRKMSYFYFDDEAEYFWTTPKGFATSVSGFLMITAGFWALLACDPNFGRRKWWAAASFAPIGATIRFLLAIHNQKTPEFPAFTFLANVLASVCNIILYTCNDLYYKDTPNAYHFSLWAMSGVSTGMMGSLSTVSTWVNEINKLTEMHPKWLLAYRYALCSVIVSQVLCLLIGGVWTSVVPLAVRSEP